jgi:hypothetical protein
MEENEPYLQIQVNELRKRSAEIDELKAETVKAKAECRVEQLDELRAKIQIARDHLVQAVFSLRNDNAVLNDQEYPDTHVTKNDI